MQPEVWRRLTDRMLEMSGKQRDIHLSLATGETFLHFDEAMGFLDHLRGLSTGQIDVEIITNGTVATSEQLRTCLEKKISLCFSIDGPASRHDAFRKSSDRKPTQRIAMRNWRRYRAMVDAVANGTTCQVYSVIAGEGRLRDVARFWRKRGVMRFKAIPAEPNRHLGRVELSEWETRRARYLEDLEALAFSEAKRLRGRKLAEEAAAPLGILSSWRRLNDASPYRSCGAGYSTIGVDADGTLYPCQGFFGYAERSIGDIPSGVDAAKLAEFRSARTRAEAGCSACWARFLCDGGCCAADPNAGVVIDAWKQCEFFKAHAEIAIQSHQSWCGYGTCAARPREGVTG
jgi:uncharacterized protein